MYPQSSLKFFCLFVLIIGLAIAAPMQPFASFAQTPSKQIPFAPNPVDFGLRIVSNSPKFVGETVTFGRLLADATDPADRFALLASNLEDQIATVFRQVAMSRFEAAVHAERRGAGELSIDRFGASAPGEVVMAELGITAEHVARTATELLAAKGS